MIHEDKDVTPKEFDSYWKKVGVFSDDRVEEIKSLCPSGKTIDLGGGSGALAKAVGATLVDWSPVACEKARKEGVESICANVLDFLRSTKEKYEVVVLADVLEEMKASETEELLDGVKKICTKYFIISTPTHENYLNISTHQVIYSKEELDEMLTKRGFTKEEGTEHSDRLIARYVCQ
jgi:2-polyprenyl-3-methyl-5-hydroxy-6-metoxy-1,4-benzoquinol methylase